MRRPRSLFFTLSVRLGLVGIAFMLSQLAVVMWMYVTNPNDLDQLLMSAEASRIARAIPAMQAGGGAVPEALRAAFAPGTSRAFLIHERSGAVVARFDDGALRVADEPPASFLVIRTQREAWGRRFLLSGTRRVVVGEHPFWISAAIAGEGFRPFVPVILNEVRVHVIFPVLLLSALFLAFNISVVRSTLRPLKAAMAAVNRVDPAEISARITVPSSSAEVRDLVAAMNRMLARVESAVRSLRDFAGHAAHELRTPLAVLLLGIGRLPESAEKAKLREDVRGMKRLVDQMLDMAYATALEIEGGAVVPLGAVARAVAGELTPLAVARGRRIVFHDAGAAAVRGQAEAIGRALRNVIENALAHAPPGTAVEVTSGPGACCTVRDHGPGIPEADRERVLERFRRLPGGSGEGAGLGLAIVQAIMAAHGGRVEIGAAPGGGALVRLSFGSG